MKAGKPPASVVEDGHLADIEDGLYIRLGIDASDVQAGIETAKVSLEGLEVASANVGSIGALCFLSSIKWRRKKNMKFKIIGKSGQPFRGRDGKFVTLNCASAGEAETMARGIFCERFGSVRLAGQTELRESGALLTEAEAHRARAKRAFARLCESEAAGAAAVRSIAQYSLPAAESRPELMRESAREQGTSAELQEPKQVAARLAGALSRLGGFSESIGRTAAVNYLRDRL
jgi:hypothetical protein